MNKYNSKFLPCPFRIPHYPPSRKNIVTIRVIKFVVLVVIAIILTIGGFTIKLRYKYAKSTLFIHNILQTYTKEPLVIIDHISNNGEFLVD